MEDDLLAEMLDFEDATPAAAVAPQAHRAVAPSPQQQGMAPSPLAPSPLASVGISSASPVSGATLQQQQQQQQRTMQQLHGVFRHYFEGMGKTLARQHPVKQHEHAQLESQVAVAFRHARDYREKMMAVTNFKEGLLRVYGQQLYDMAKGEVMAEQAASARAAKARQQAGVPPQHHAALVQQQQQQRQAAQQQAAQQQAAQQQAAQQRAVQQAQQQAAAQQQALLQQQQRAAQAQAQPAARAASPFPAPAGAAGGIVVGQAAGPQAAPGQAGAASIQHQQQLLAAQQQMQLAMQQQQQQQQAAAKKRPADAAAAGAIGATLGGGGGSEGPAAKRAKVGGGGGGGATPGKAKKDDDVGVTVDNLFDYDQETNQLMEGLQRSRTEGRTRQHTASNQQFLSEWRLGNEFYRQIQRTGGGLKVKGECFELMQLAFQAHMNQVISSALRNAQHRQDASRRSGDVVVTSDPRRGVTQIERREKVKADAKAEAERTELLRIAGSKRADEETKERAQKAKAELVGKQQASLANAAVAATLGGKAKGKANKWDKWSSAAAAPAAAAAGEGDGAVAKGKKGGGGKKGGKKAGAGADGGGGGSATEGEAGGSDADKGKAPAAVAARGRGLSGAGGAASHGSDDASTIHLRDVLGVLERDPMYCRSPMLYRLHNTPRAGATVAPPQ